VVPADLREYGSCPCYGQYEERFVEVRMALQGRTVILTEVPQGSCMRCGSLVYKPEVLERIESLMMGRRAKRAG
jgi:hypothetical protein